MGCHQSLGYISSSEVLDDATSPILKQIEEESELLTADEELRNKEVFEIESDKEDKPSQRWSWSHLPTVKRRKTMIRSR